MNIIIENDEKKDIFTQIFRHLTQFSQMVNFRLDKEKFYIQGMDSNHISLFEINLCGDWFQTYSIEKPLILGINIELFSKILNFRTKDQKIILNITNTDKLQIMLESDDKKTLSKKFEITTYDIDSDLMLIPNVEYQADFIFETPQLKDLIDQMGTFAEMLTFHCTEEYIEISSNGDEGEMTTKLDFDYLEEYSIEEDGNINLKFNMKYISQMLKYQNIFKNVHVHLSETIPLKINYKLDENNHICFFLAPQISDY